MMLVENTSTELRKVFAVKGISQNIIWWKRSIPFSWAVDVRTKKIELELCSHYCQWSCCW